jgi:hypothetical protein
MLPCLIPASLPIIVSPSYYVTNEATRCTCGWVDGRAGVDVYGEEKISVLKGGLNSGASSPWRVAVPTGLSRPLIYKFNLGFIYGLLIRRGQYFLRHNKHNTPSTVYGNNTCVWRTVSTLCGQNVLFGCESRWYVRLPL